ncbi:MAG: type II secretion system secretin GspD [Deltaproteobacteria bacterium]|nr:type II secretion system secretin GspD [Deltaproteobacteria bacterium]
MTAATVSGQVPPPPQPGSSYEELNVPKAVPVKPTAETRAAAPGATPVPGADEGLYLNAVDTDVREIIKQIAKVTGKNFLVDQSVRGKVTIISEKKMTIEEAYQAFLSALEVLGFTVVNAPGDLVKVIPMKEALQNPLPIYKDDSPVTDAFITRLIQMRNISALEMSNAVKTLVSKEGNLFAYPATNTLIVTDTGSNIDRLLKIMRELDQEGPSETIDIIPLRFAGAKDVANKINELYADDLKGKAPTAAAARRPAARGPELEETPYISKIIPDDRTNSVIVLASKRALTKVRELVARLDRKLEAGTEGKIHVHYLKHANAKDLAQVLSTLTASSVTASRVGAAGTPPGGATPGRQATATEVTAEFEGGVKIAPDENTNALIITATAKDYNTLAKEVIDKLDIPRKQVYVEVVIMELTIDKNRTLGVSGQGGGQFNLGGNPTLGFGSSLGGTAAGLSAAALSGLAAGVVSQTTQTIPVTNADGTVTNLEIPTFGVILNALQTDTDVNVLSTPNLLTLDNEEAEIVVGATQPFPSGTTLTPGGNTTFNVTREDVGIKLKMTPQINEGDVVKIKLKQEISSVVPGASETVLTSLGPTTTKRSVETVVAAKDQQTIVIGGLIDDKVTITTAKVPFLGDIPIFGNLFKNKKTTKAKTNILVFLRPFIIRDSKDFLKILQKKVEERNMFVSQNYGKGQQKVIRQSIRNHAADLLEFRRDIQRVDWEFQNDTGTRVVPIDTNPASSGSRGSSDSSRLTDHDQQLIQAAQTDDAR